MSVQAMTWVIDHSSHKSGEFIVLLMIANHAHANGTGAYPGIEALARESRLSERQIIRIVRRLEKSGELRVDRGQGPHGTHLYSLPLMTASPPEDSGWGGDKMSPDKREPQMSPEPSGTVSVNVNSGEINIEKALAIFIPKRIDSDTDKKHSEGLARVLAIDLEAIRNQDRRTMKYLGDRWVEKGRPGWYGGTTAIRPMIDFLDKSIHWCTQNQTHYPEVILLRLKQLQAAARRELKHDNS